MKLPEYTDQEGQDYFEDMPGWTAFQPVLADISDSEECLKRMKFELENKKRKFIYDRLVQKYNKLKAKKAEVFLYDYFYR